MESVNQFEKIQKWRSENTVSGKFQIIMECPRSLLLLLPSTQKRSIAPNYWNPTWLAGTGLSATTGKPTEIATVEIFVKIYGLHFL